MHPTTILKQLEHIFFDVKTVKNDSSKLCTHIQEEMMLLM